MGYLKKYQQIAIAFLLTPIFAWAGDLSRDVREGVNNPQASESNYVELGMSVGTFTSPFYGLPEGNDSHKTMGLLTLDLNLHLQYKGFFMEGFSQSLEQFTLGYHCTEGDQWSLDAVALEQHTEVSEDESKDLKGIKARYGDYMFGLRATGYYENYIVQLHALTDISDTHNGQVLSFKIARHWQYKNWNIHAIESASYRTASVANYYLGVEPQDATEKFHAFQARSGFTQVFEVGATYPINQKWVFRSLLRHIELDKQWRNSPLLTDTHGNMFVNSIDYVF